MNAPGTASQISPIAGLGLFATRTFNADERIAAYTGPLTTTPPVHPRQANAVYSLEIEPGCWLDGSLDDNPARHANHSCEPNAELIWEGRAEGAWLVATSPILAGQEITFDYGFTLADSLLHPCHCGTPTCAGRIIASPQRSSLRRHLRFSRPRD